MCSNYWFTLRELEGLPCSISMILEEFSTIDQIGLLWG